MPLFTRSTLNKAWVTYSILCLGFLLSLMVNINFVSDRAVTTLSQLQQSHSQLQVQSSFNNIQQFIENRAILLAELAESPMVTTSVMGVELVAANLHDMLNERKILGAKEHIYVSDFTGELIYPKKSIRQPAAHVIEQIIQQQVPLVVEINRVNAQHYFSLSMPVSYHGHVEGMITFDIISRSIESLLSELTQNSIYAASFYQQDKLIFETSALDNFSSVANFSIDNTDINVHFYVSNKSIQSEKERYVWQIGSTLTFTTLLAFLLLVFLIRSLLINPLEKLALSKQKIKQSEQRYQLAIDGSNDGIWDWNIEQQQLYLSPRLVKMTGDKLKSRIDLTQKNINLLELIVPEDRKQLRQAFYHHLRREMPFDCEFRLKVKAKEYSYFRMRGIALRNEKGQAIRMSGSLSDITALKEQRLALEKALTEAQSANIAKSHFLANMSHEIRTPMNGVLGALQVLKREKLSESSEKMVEMAINSSNNLLHIVNDILDLSKIESNNINLELLATNVIELCESIHAEHLLLAEQKKLQLSFKASKDLAEYWLVDPVRLRQILVNLVSNAIKFTHQGQVSLNLTKHNAGLLFEVKDTGIGISQANIDKLFNRFEQADDSTTRQFGGTGLGLSIAKQLANLMGGNIFVQSEVNQGTTFKVLLPLEKAQVTLPTDHNPQSAETPDFSGLKLMLAEDNEINQVVFSSLVSPTNVSLQIANNGIEAVDNLGQQLPDIIFMDIQMPKMDGMQACEIIKSLHPDIPIVALTANVMAQDVDRYKKIGFDYCLGKPINVTEVFEILRKYAKKNN